jgi:CheY-like chemotaxis protein
MKTETTYKIILLADDDPEDAEMFSLVLDDVDPSVKFSHVDNGLGVFDYLQEKKNPTPDLIFLDINMPEMSGWQCLSLLKENPVTKNIPVMMYSTSSHPKDRQTAFELGATAFITKPSDYKGLQTIVLSVTDTLHNQK